jgi:hypothetical protein
VSCLYQGKISSARMLLHWYSGPPGRKSSIMTAQAGHFIQLTHPGFFDAWQWLASQDHQQVKLVKMSLWWSAEKTFTWLYFKTIQWPPNAQIWQTKRANVTDQKSKQVLDHSKRWLGRTRRTVDPTK